MQNEIRAAKDTIVAAYLRTSAGEKMLSQAIAHAALAALDKLPQGSLKYYMARKLAGLPPLYELR